MLTALFSDRLRGVKLGSALLVAALLALWGASERTERCISLDDALNHPGACNQALVAIGLARVQQADEAVFSVPVQGRLRSFAQPERKLVAGQYVSLRGRFTPPDGFTPEFIHPHRSRGAKVWLSLVAALGVAGYAVRAFWPGRGGIRA